MENNLPQEYKKGFLNKIKEFFSKMFNRDSNNTNQSEMKIEEKKTVEKNSIEKLKEETKKGFEQESLINQLIKNPELVRNWPIEKLEKLNTICDEKMSQLDFEIATLSGK